MTNPVFKDPPAKYTATAGSLLVHVCLLTMTCRLGTESERLRSLFFLESVCTQCLTTHENKSEAAKMQGRDKSFHHT